jgi:hypothetical protein
MRRRVGLAQLLDRHRIRSLAVFYASVGNGKKSVMRREVRNAAT